jgi:hypothetical protein
MQNRMKWSSAPAVRGTPCSVSVPGDPVIRARLVTAVQRAVAAKPVDERDVLGSLYAATRDRTRELRQEGRRAEEALMILKRESAEAATVVGSTDPAASAARMAVLIQHVVRWSVATYYATN